MKAGGNGRSKVVLCGESEYITLFTQVIAYSMTSSRFATFSMESQNLILEDPFLTILFGRDHVFILYHFAEERLNLQHVY